MVQKIFLTTGIREGSFMYLASSSWCIAILSKALDERQVPRVVEALTPVLLIGNLLGICDLDSATEAGQFGLQTLSLETNNSLVTAAQKKKSSFKIREWECLQNICFSLASKTNGKLWLPFGEEYFSGILHEGNDLQNGRKRWSKVTRSHSPAWRGSSK